MRIHTTCVNIGNPAFSVHGALSDHYRLMRQFGAVPLMYYLFGDRVISTTTERILMGSQGHSFPLETRKKTTVRVARETYAFTQFFDKDLKSP